jgi:hypothetical protein
VAPKAGIEAVTLGVINLCRFVLLCIVATAFSHPVMAAQVTNFTITPASVKAGTSDYATATITIAPSIENEDYYHSWQFPDLTSVTVVLNSPGNGAYICVGHTPEAARTCINTTQGGTGWLYV